MRFIRGSHLQSRDVLLFSEKGATLLDTSQILATQTPLLTQTMVHVGQKDQDGYNAEKCHFFNFGA